MDTLENIETDRYHMYAKGLTLEVSDKVTLASFLIELLEIQNDDTSTL